MHPLSMLGHVDLKLKVKIYSHLLKVQNPKPIVSNGGVLWKTRVELYDVLGSKLGLWSGVLHSYRLCGACYVSFACIHNALLQPRTQFGVVLQYFGDFEVHMSVNSDPGQPFCTNCVLALAA